MKTLRRINSLAGLVLLWIAFAGCYELEDERLVLAESSSTEQITGEDIQLDDGVYPVIADDSNPDGDLQIIELVNVPVPGEESPPATIRVIDQPVLFFSEVPDFDFTFEKGECTRIGFQTTESLKAYTKDNLGSRLAVVIGNRVISVHKIRDAIVSDQVQITCCTVGGGDHLHKHLTELKLKSNPTESLDDNK